MNLFYCPHILTAAVLDEEETRHLAVLRQQAGEVIHLFDGNGSLYTAVIQEIKKRETLLMDVEVIRTDDAGKAALHIAIAPPKNMDRLEWFGEKVTEIGVGRITPIICQRSERKEVKTERLFKILLSAAKQSLKLTIPKIDEAISFKKLVTHSFPDTTKKFIAYCEEKPIHLKDAFEKGEDVIVLVGPEGDFTPDEILLAKENGFQIVGLGESRLRLETAGVMVSAIFNLVNEI